jgi:hypothetical protein
MADFTLSSGNICRPFRSPWGAFPTRHMPLSSGISSNAIVLGRVVALDANTDSNAGQILPSSLTAGVVVSTVIVGIAAESPGLPGSTNTRGTEIPVWEANPNVEFVANTQGAVLGSSQIGKPKALVWDSTLSITKVDLSNSTVAVVRCIVTELVDEAGDSGGKVAFKFLTQTPVGSTDNCLAFYR